MTNEARILKIFALAVVGLMLALAWMDWIFGPLYPPRLWYLHWEGSLNLGAVFGIIALSSLTASVLNPGLSDNAIVTKAGAVGLFAAPVFTLTGLFGYLGSTHFLILISGVFLAAIAIVDFFPAEGE